MTYYYQYWSSVTGIPTGDESCNDNVVVPNGADEHTECASLLPSVDISGHTLSRTWPNIASLGLGLPHKGAVTAGEMGSIAAATTGSR